MTKGAFINFFQKVVFSVMIEKLCAFLKELSVIV